MTKSMWKRLFAVLLAAAMLMSFAACSNDSDDDDDDDKKSSKSSPSSAVDVYIDIMLGKATDPTDLLPAALWTYVAEQEDMTVQEVKDEIISEADSGLSYYETQYGDNLNITYKLTNSNELDKETLADIQEEFDSILEITAAVTADVKMTIKGDDDSTTSEQEWTFIKVGSKYYILQMIRSYFNS